VCKIFCVAVDGDYNNITASAAERITTTTAVNGNI